MVGVVQDGLGRNSRLRDTFNAEWTTDVEVPIPRGEIAARDLYTNTMAGLEDVGGRARSIRYS